MSYKEDSKGDLNIVSPGFTEFKGFGKSSTKQSLGDSLNFYNDEKPEQNQHKEARHGVFFGEVSDYNKTFKTIQGQLQVQFSNQNNVEEVQKEAFKNISTTVELSCPGEELFKSLLNEVQASNFESYKTIEN